MLYMTSETERGELNTFPIRSDSGELSKRSTRKGEPRLESRIHALETSAVILGAWGATRASSYFCRCKRDVCICPHIFYRSSEQFPMPFSFLMLCGAYELKGLRIVSIFCEESVGRALNRGGIWGNRR